MEIKLVCYKAGCRNYGKEFDADTNEYSDGLKAFRLSPYDDIQCPECGNTSVTIEAGCKSCERFFDIDDMYSLACLDYYGEFVCDFCMYHADSYETESEIIQLMKDNANTF